MDKLDLKTKDLKKENIEKLSELFPEILTEIEKDGQFIKTINVDKLKELIGDYADKEKEVYELSWAGKQKAKMKVYEPINKTLRPVIEDSVDFENTENLYIEGDNFEVLKLLKESYANKIKMIYIDPPYNTGKDFVYKDNFKSSKGEYEDKAGLVDDEGNRLYTKNEKTNPWYHSDWLNMMYERLSLAYKLLRKDGVIFISIDHNEKHNLRKLCDEIFGEGNFLLDIVWKRRGGAPNDKKMAFIHENILVYCKSIADVKLNLMPRDIGSESRFKNPDNDPKGMWCLETFSVNAKGGRYTPTCDYVIKNPKTGQKFAPPSGRNWRCNEQNYFKLLKDGRVLFGIDGNGAPQYKKYASEIRNGFTTPSIWDDVGFTATGTKEVTDLIKTPVFDTPKTINLLKRVSLISTSSNDIILDFFSGSATTAHAVMQLNVEDQGNRKYIMVQLPEETQKDSEAFKAGYKNICEIGKERIRRAAKKIQEENKDKDLSNIDFGFRVFKLDDSNMKDVYYNPKKINQDLLQNFNEVVKEDRTSEDLLFQVMLSMGVPISEKVEIKEIENTKVFQVANYLIACFEKNITHETIKKIVELKPLRIVFKESCFKDDSAMINASEYIKNVLFDGDEKNFKNNVKLI